MDFNLTGAQKKLRQRTEDFAAQHCTGEAMAALDREPRYPEELHQALAEAGILGHCLPEALGGGDGGLVDAAIINEVLGRSSDAAVNILFINMSSAALVAMAGSKEQKQEIVPGVAEGKTRMAFALTEPGAGSDAAGIQSQAEKKGDGWVINGEKLYTTGAAEADYILTVVRTDLEAKAKSGTSLFLVPGDAKGLTIEPLDKLAGNAVASCRVVYDGVEVGPDALLGGENQAWGTLMMGGGLERVIVAASCLGRAQQILDEVVEFARNRQQFGQPVAQFQAIQHQIADMATEIEAMRWLTYNAAWRADQGEMPIKQISMAKLYASERLNEIANRGMRLLGGRAYLKDSPMQQHLRESLLSLYAGGTVEIQRNLIARSVLS